MAGQNDDGRTICQMDVDFMVTLGIHKRICADRECIDMNEWDSVREMPRLEHGKQCFHSAQVRVMECNFVYHIKYYR
jgi:hypothetical protein